MVVVIDFVQNEVRPTPKQYCLHL